MALIEQARKNLHDQGPSPEEQEQMNKLFSEMYQKCHDLIEQHGINFPNPDIEWPKYRRIYIQSLDATRFDSQFARSKKILLNEIGNDNQKVNSAMLSLLDSQVGDSIFVVIEGLNEAIQLYEDSADIRDGQRYRRSTINDANNWSEIVNLVKQKYQSTQQKQ